MARLKKPLLIVGALLALAGIIGARRELKDVEREAALWAEATDPIE